MYQLGMEQDSVDISQLRAEALTFHEKVSKSHCRELLPSLSCSVDATFPAGQGYRRLDTQRAEC